MSTRDLNIIERGIAGQDWSQERGKISAKELSQVGEQSTSSTSALNALPTPFARFYVVKEAFRRVKEEYVSKRINAGYAYRQLVSDCLDVYELLFNLKYHHNHWKGKEILVREWDKETEMARLKETVPKLYNSVSAYWETDINQDKLYFIVLREAGKEKLLATSSPWTGFVTPPDLDKTLARDDSNTIDSEFNAIRYADLHLKKKDKGEYFRDVVLFEKRPADFKNYMYNVLFGQNGLDDRLSEIRDYIRAFKDDPDIRNDYKQSLRSVKTGDDNDLVVNGLVFSSKDEKDAVSMFNDVVIKLPYRISETNYFVPQMNGKEDRKYDYLLPLSEEALKVLDLDAIEVHYREYGGKNLEVTVKDTDGKVYKRTYIKSYNRNDRFASSTGVEGEIVDLSDSESYNINIDTAFFPSLLHCSANEAENNYFKLMVAVRDANRMPRLKGEDVDCTFYVNKDGRCECLYKTEALDKNGLTSGSKKGVVRSVQDGNTACCTVFFEVFNAVPCAFSIKLKIDGRDVSGLLIPHVKKSSATVKLTYAIDFGTTNTYISKREQGNDFAPSQLTMTDTMMSYLHGIAKVPMKPIDQWEDVPFVDAKSYFQTEFVPPFIDGEKYKFPLRTAISKRVRKDARPELFDNCNIAFSYGKTKKAGDNEVSTDIKWDGANDERRLFIRELLLIVKADALQSNADLARTELVWFYPLSMNAEALNDLTDIWNKQAEEVLGIPTTQIKHYTESEAPYYYLSQTDDFKSVSSVAIVDIGGGSTDVVYFENNKPLLANSVHFGCDVMWGNAYAKIANSRKNGIYEYYKNQVTFPFDATLKGINEEMTAVNSEASTRDIINFWIANSDKIEVKGRDFNKVLRRDCKPLFLYHYAAIIYYMARMFKSRDLACPRDIAFSGNGSRYIDGYLTPNIKKLEAITKKVFCKVYGKEVDNIHIILPDCRKETTCYGGLYHDRIQVQGQSLDSPEEIFFQGVDKTEYKKVADLREAYNSGLRNALINSIEELNEIYFEMLDMLIGEDDIQNISVSSLEDGMLSNEIADSLDKNFQNEVLSKYGDNKKYRDSLFFLPIVSNIHALTYVTKYKVENDV